MKKVKTVKKKKKKSDFEVCRCGAIGTASQICPYQEDVYGNVMRCNCCAECCNACVQDI